MIAKALFAVALLAVASAQTPARIRVNPSGTLTISEGFSQVLTFSLDEPIICPESNSRECNVVVLITNSHPNQVGMSNCHVKWRWDEWAQQRTITIRALEDFVDDGEKTITLVTNPASSLSDYYNSFNPADIVLKTVPRRSSQCSSTGDPHYSTFDGFPYHIYAPGRVVFYKSKSRDFEVQTDMYSFLAPAVHCAVAAKEGNNIVVISLCHDGATVRYRRSCGDQTCLNGGFPKVGITTGSDPRYVISFESGAQITAQISYWAHISRRYINMYATAPGRDWNDVVGVCGNNDGISNNDVNVGYNQWIYDLKNLKPEQLPTTNLFDWYPSAVAPLPTLSPYQKECNYTEPPFIRQILNNPDVEDLTDLLKDNLGKDSSSNQGNNFVLDNADDVPEPISKEQAAAICETIRRAQVTRACVRIFPTFDVQSYIDQCIEDVAETGGDTLFVENAVAALEADCADLGNRDQNTWETDNNGQPVEPNLALQDTMCPRGCSGHGQCVKTKCLCEEPWKGDDCATNPNAPPSIESIPDKMCDGKGRFACPKEITVQGFNFWKSDKLACKFGDVVTEALYLGSQEILCAVPQRSHSGSQEVTVPVSVTTDGATWSAAANAATFTWYDSICQVCTLLTGCAPNPASCTIGGVCYLATQSSMDNNCMKCVPSRSTSAWSYVYSNSIECGPKFELTFYSAKIVEKTTVGAPLITMNAANQLVAGDASNKVTYALSSALPHSFKIDAATGVVSAAQNLVVADLPLSFNNYLLVVATDSAGNRAETNLLIELVKTNTNPFFDKSEYTLTIRENSPIDTPVGTISAKDLDSNPEWSKLQYTWQQQEIGWVDYFNVNATTGLITVNKPIDFEAKASYNLHLMVKDGGSQFHSTAVTINVINVNEPPTSIALSNTRIEENKPVNTVVGVLSAVDPEAADTHTFAIKTAGVPFAIVSKNQLVATASFDFEKGPAVYALIVEATDSGSPAAAYQTVFTINVVDVNEAPKSIALKATSFGESAKVDSKLTEVTVQDDDRNQMVGCALTDTASGTFAVQGTTASTISLVLLKSLDFETAPSLSIEITCVDDGTPALKSAATRFTITVINENDPPSEITLTLASADGVAENSADGTVVGTLSAKDQDITAGAINFAVDGSFAVGASTCRKVANANVCTAPVTVKGALNFEATPVVTMTVTAVDDTGAFSTKAVQVPLKNVREVPTGIEWINGANSVAEFSPAGTVVGQIKVIDDDAGEVYSFELVEGAAAFEVVADRRREVVGAVATIRVRDASLLDFETMSTMSIKLSVTDSSASNTALVFATTIQVTDAPITITFADGSTMMTFPENQAVNSVLANVVLKNSDRPGVTATLSLSDNSHGTFALSGSSLTLTKALNYEGAFTNLVLVKATFSGPNAPLPVESKLIVAVSNVNEAPIFVGLPASVNVYEHSNIGTTVVELLAEDPEKTPVTYELTTSLGSIFTISRSNNLRVASVPHDAGVVAGEYTIEITATSDGLSTKATIKVVITDDCATSPCGSNGKCIDGDRGYTCACREGFGGLDCALTGDALRAFQEANGLASSGSSDAANSVSGATVAGIVVGVLFLIVLVALVAFFVLRREKEQPFVAPALEGYDAPDFNSMHMNPTFVAPKQQDESYYAETSGPVLRFEPGVANPIYDWYQPDMERNECSSFLYAQGEGAFVVRDSKATPGWHMIGVKTHNSVVHEKIRLCEDGMYELLPTGCGPQPRFPDIPALVEHYAIRQEAAPFTLAYSNPIYDNHQLANGVAASRNRDSIKYRPFLPNDPAAPALPLKEREVDAVKQLAANQTAVAEGEELYTNTEEAKLIFSRA